MNKIILSNKHLTTIARELGEEFNKIEFLTWYSNLNKEFKYDSHPMAGAVGKHFSGSKEHVKLFEFPEVEINDEKKLKEILDYAHGSYREPLIQVLKDDFGIDYWQEILKFAVNNEKLGYSSYYGLLSHSMNDYEFTENNIDSFKTFLDNFISSINQSKYKKFSEIIQYMSYAITNKDLFGNDWLVNSLNQIFKTPDDGSSKNFNFQVDKLSHHFMNLDFSKVLLNPELKRVLKGKLPLTTTSEIAKPFFWSIDLPRYCMTHKVVQELLSGNCITGMEIIDSYIKDDSDVLSHFIKREKNKISLSVIHESSKLEDKLNVLLEMMLKKTEMNTLVDRSDLEKSLVLIDLKDNMQVNEKKTKAIKV